MPEPSSTGDTLAQKHPGVLKRLFVVSTGAGAGVVFATSMLYWYTSRPAPVLPWNNEALIATYSHMAAQDGGRIAVYFDVQNRTNEDYELSIGGAPTLVSRTGDENGTVLWQFDEGLTTLDLTPS